MNEKEDPIKLKMDAMRKSQVLRKEQKANDRKSALDKYIKQTTNNK